MSWSKTIRNWSRRRLSRELCVNWAWRNAKGELRDIACRTVLLRLHRAGEITLPVGRHNGNNHRRQDSIVEVDVDEALNAASAIGDDTLQKQSGGAVVPESFTHGTSAQRQEWFRAGLQSGDPDQCNTFS